MGIIKDVLLLLMLLVTPIPDVFGIPVTAPAFMWSPQHYGSSNVDKKELVVYQTITPRDLASLVLSEGGWSDLVCSREDADENIDVAILFIGRKLQSSDVSSAKVQDPSLIEMLKFTFTTSNVSMAFPYVTIDELETLEDSLVKGFTENCGQGSGMNRIAYLNTCSINGENGRKLEGLHSLEGFLDSRTSGKTDLIVLCHGSSEESDSTHSEGEVLSDVVDLLKESGAKYTFLYASRPHGIQYPTRLAVRYLAEGTGNASANSTCDGICQLKSSLLEGVFVAIVLLIILISGLCCMAGIDTPTRFETPQES
ncbi:uncharacterized protein LOC122038900 [Zingiber officinale]|uniref:uncharacterized protein LOC122038900 n=1 Tax=Zingiber officinale TaxID=94328 RepID=UPI001C4D3426|nr:uncharacterized protein LOC122038900 [Zingiber officinale]